MNDQAEIVQSRLFFNIEFDAFLGSGFYPVRQVEMNDVARMFKIADVKRYFQGAPSTRVRSSRIRRPVR